jgi:hypothetical protein
VNTTARYKNPWYRPKEPWSWPEYFTTNINPISCRGALIYRVHGKQHDVVKNGTCITQVVGLEYAKECARMVEHLPAPTPKDLRDIQLAAPCQACGKMTPEQEYSERHGYIDLCGPTCLAAYLRT